jgi:hypothetical protein
MNDQSWCKSQKWEKIEDGGSTKFLFSWAQVHPNLYDSADSQMHLLGFYYQQDLHGLSYTLFCFEATFMHVPAEWQP